MKKKLLKFAMLVLCVFLSTASLAKAPLWATSQFWAATAQTVNAPLMYATAEETNVAKIGDVEYASLADAIAAVTDGTETTITMIANEAIDVAGSGITIAAGQNIVLDLNGYEVAGVCSTGTGSALITNNGTLTIKDSSDPSTGKMTYGATPAWIYEGGDNYSGSYASNLITNSGTLTIESGEFYNNANGSACYVVDNHTGGDVTINDGTLTAAGNSAVRMFCNSTAKENNVTVNGGTLTATYYAISMQNANTNANKGSLSITGGEFEATAEEWNCSVACWSASDNFDIAITGGKFNDNVVIAEGVKATITDGQFKYVSFTDTEDGIVYNLSDFVAEGFELVENESGYYGIEKRK